MQQHEDQTCADCGIPCKNLLCERCAEICNILTAAGEYYAYRRALRSGRARPLVSSAATGTFLGLTPVGQVGHG